MMNTDRRYERAYFARSVQTRQALVASMHADDAIVALRERLMGEPEPEMRFSGVTLDRLHGEALAADAACPLASWECLLLAYDPCVKHNVTEADVAQTIAAFDYVEHEDLQALMEREHEEYLEALDREEGFVSAGLDRPGPVDDLWMPYLGRTADLTEHLGSGWHVTRLSA